MKLLALIFAILPLAAQNGPIPGRTDSYHRYQAIDSESLISSTTAVTIQQPASPAYLVVFETLTVRCSVACSFTLSQNGSAATSTALGIAALNNSPATSVKAFYKSNASGGTTLGTYYLEAAGTCAIDMSKFQLQRIAGNNLTVATSSVTGNVEIIAQWIEK